MLPGMDTELPQPARRKPGFWQLTGWLLAFAILALFAGLLHRLGFEIYLALSGQSGTAMHNGNAFGRHMSQGYGVIIFYLVQLTLTLPVLLHASSYPDQNWRTTLAVHKVRIRSLLMWLGIWFISLPLLNLTLQHFDMPQEKFAEQMARGMNWSIALTVILLAPVLEEFVFRGFLFNALRTTWLGRWGTILLTAGLFAILHTQYQSTGLIAVFVLGLLTGSHT